MAKNAKVDTKNVKNQYHTFDEFTKSYITAVLYTMSSMFFAIYHIQNINQQEEKSK